MSGTPGINFECEPLYCFDLQKNRATQKTFETKSNQNESCR